jgi:Cu(I)/Ag(I) efflux system membrane protein CusA/SilA
MIDRILEFSIRNRAVVLLAGILLALGGVYAVYHTPVDAIPDLSEDQVLVFTEWPGHSPREIDDQLTYPLSLHLQGLADVRVVRSSSEINFSLLSVIFEDGVDFYFARQQVAERLARAREALPTGVTPYVAPDAAATGQIYWYTVEGGGLDLGRLRALQDWYVKPQLSSVPGVAEVASVGGYVGEYQIEVDPHRLHAHGVAASDVVAAVAHSNAAAGGDVVHKGNAEYVVRSAGWLGSGADFEPQRVVRDLESTVVPAPGGVALRLSDLATVAQGARPRRGVLEKDGSEVVGGVVLMRQGENPLAVTRRLQHKIQELQVGLPAGVRVVPFYDRTPLIESAIGTVTGTLVEAILTATVCVLLVLLHFRTSFVIALTLPLAVLASFAIMWLLRRFGIADIQTNIMSLAGIAISIGVLVDSSVVMAENVMHHLKEHFGDKPVHGDVRELVLPACRTVGRPIFFSVLIMLLSFLPVFALGGMEGKMFRPLAFTKSFALCAVAVLAITVVPALCTIFIKGRLRRETESWLVRGVMQVYRPALDYFLDRPAALVWFVAVTFVVGLAPLGSRAVLLTTLGAGLLACWVLTRRAWSRALACVSLLLIALVAEQRIEPLGREFMTPLDEGMVMDMPITVPRASVAQAADDLKARDMIFCRFPEVDMVVGKAGRAETPTDPAPLDMIETMVNFRPPEFWPKRKLRAADAERQAAAVVAALLRRGIALSPPDPAVTNEAMQEAMPLFDAQMREYAYQRNKEFERGLGGQLVRHTVEQTAALLRANGSLTRPLTASDLALLSRNPAHDHAEHLAMAPALEDVTALARATAHHLAEMGLLNSAGDPLHYRPNLLAQGAILVHTTLGGSMPTFFTRLHDAVLSRYRALWLDHTARLNGELHERATLAWTRLVLLALLDRVKLKDTSLAASARELKRQWSEPPAVEVHGGGHHHGGRVAAPTVEPHPVLDSLQAELAKSFAGWVLLWPKDRADLAGFGGDLDRVMQMPGWTNVWTMPIQNRVDMLSTGVNTAIGIRVLGRNLEAVVRASEDVAAVVKKVPGAADVVADPVRGKGYLEIRPDRERAARHGVRISDINDLVEIALGGKVATTTVEGRERHAVRVRYPRGWREDEESVRNLLVGTQARGMQPAGFAQIPLSEVAQIRIAEGPATIKSENGLLRNYVRLNVRGRDAAEFVDEARRVVADRVPLPAGVYLEWTGQFEHEVRARGTLRLVVPLVVVLIFLILYLTYHDLADAVLMLLAVPGAIAGGVFFQWVFGYKFSVTVWIGYLACFGMATSTGIIMLVYLRAAVARAGGLADITLEQLRRAVLDGAVHRLRPKLLTEGVTILGLAPLLWATGTAADVIKPMVVPVLGGLLIADEIIDLFLPVLFYRVRQRRWQRLRGTHR